MMGVGRRDRRISGGDGRGSGAGDLLCVQRGPLATIKTAGRLRSNCIDHDVGRDSDWGCIATDGMAGRPAQLSPRRGPSHVLDNAGKAFEKHSETHHARRGCGTVSEIPTNLASCNDRHTVVSAPSNMGEQR